MSRVSCPTLCSYRLVCSGKHLSPEPQALARTLLNWHQDLPSTHTLTLMHMYTNTHLHTHTYTHTRTHAHTHTYTCRYTHRYTHTSLYFFCFMSAPIKRE